MLYILFWCCIVLLLSTVSTVSKRQHCSFVQTVGFYAEFSTDLSVMLFFTPSVVTMVHTLCPHSISASGHIVTANHS